MTRCFGAVLLALCLAGCAAVPGAADPAAARMRQGPADLILLTVANPAQPVAQHAGSSLRGYDSLPLYSAGGSARAAVVAIEQDYGLHEVAAWPIAPLQVHCVVLEIPAGSSRDDLRQLLIVLPAYVCWQLAKFHRRIVESLYSRVHLQFERVIQRSHRPQHQFRSGWRRRLHS